MADLPTICDECAREYPAEQIVECDYCYWSLCPECYEKHSCDACSKENDNG